jgi:Brp/Blh family beta-carotene 15,15'-monooxygenase
MELIITPKKIDIFYIGISLFFLFLASMSITPSTSLQLYLFLAGAVVIGLPHGSLDYDIAKYLGFCNSLKQKIFFFSGYLTASFTYFVLWSKYPAFAFSLFLIVSIRHFGEDWSSKPFQLLKQYTYGLAFLVLPSIYYDATIEEMFSLFVPEIFSRQLMDLAQLFSVPIAVAVLACIVMDIISKKYLLVVRACVFLASAVFLTPILFFFLYFCALHSPHHTWDLYKKLEYKSFTSMVKNQIFIIIFTLGIISAIALFENTSRYFDLSIFKSVIIFIACVTAPHMMLVHYFQHQYKKETAMTCSQ